MNGNFPCGGCFFRVGFAATGRVVFSAFGTYLTFDAFYNRFLCGCFGAFGALWLACSHRDERNGDEQQTTRFGFRKSHFCSVTFVDKYKKLSLVKPEGTGTYALRAQGY
ncbi:MAG: hypothetical protein LBT73_00600 [Tannerellaceae bacterium]|nr:hypothetical protein [Tannerellaceae bacterium]